MEGTPTRRESSEGGLRVQKDTKTGGVQKDTPQKKKENPGGKPVEAVTSEGDKKTK